MTPKTDASQRIRQENQLIGEVRQSRTEADWLGQAWINPVAGRISGVFGSRRILNGVPKTPIMVLILQQPRALILSPLSLEELP